MLFHFEPSDIFPEGGMQLEQDEIEIILSSVGIESIVPDEEGNIIINVRGIPRLVKME